MILQKFITGKKERRVRVNRVDRADLVREQVKKVLTDTDQKLILMVRG